MIQLKSISITDFRSIRGSITVPLDAPIVLIHGQNGAGKTSLLSAIELGLTGHVPSLQRADQEYVGHLIHKAAETSQVQLQATGLPQDLLHAQIDITRQGIAGTSLLTPESARFYNERCFLAQATLSRLLEIYEHKDTRKGSSPLTQFVKDLLGLDHLDALIDGLYDAGDVRRFRSSVPLYWETRENIPALQKTIEQQQAELQVALNSKAEVVNRLVERLSVLGLDAELSSDPTALLLCLRESPEEPQLQRLATQRREVSAVRQQCLTIDSGISGQQRQTAEQQAANTSTALETWRAVTGEKLEEALTIAMTFFPDIPPSASVGAPAALSSALQRIDTELKRCTTALARANEDSQKLESLDQSIEKAKFRTNIIEQQITGHATDAGQLAAVLSGILPHVHTESCPVCERDFRETSSVPLHTHIAERITQLSTSAAQLQQLSRERAATTSDQAAAERERAVVASRQLDTDALDKLKTREARLKELREALKVLEFGAAEGNTLTIAATTASRTLADMQSKDLRLANIRETITHLSANLDLEPLDPTQPMTMALDHLETHVSNQEATLSRQQSTRRAAIVDAQEITTLGNRLSALETSIRDLNDRVSLLSDHKNAADSLIKDARELSNRVRNARTDIVRRIFNEELNTLWRDLFVRLAPEEPFVPAFALPSNNSGAVEAALETHYKSGGSGGNPRAMLSSGNLNTAALTLFLALHLSVTPTLPWLVIDDPVQSMDEVHIAQFAALLRTLSKTHKRQIIIAVHEKPLFDYLALELSPAFPTDRLITIELSRNADGMTLMNYQPIIWQPDIAIAA